MVDHSRSAGFAPVAIGCHARQIGLSPFQGAVAGQVNGVAVLGNVFGPMIGTTLYEISPIGPYVLNAAIMAAAWVLVFANRRLRTLRA